MAELKLKEQIWLLLFSTKLWEQLTQDVQVTLLSFYLSALSFCLVLSCRCPSHLQGFNTALSCFFQLCGGQHRQMFSISKARVRARRRKVGGWGAIKSWGGKDYTVEKKIFSLCEVSCTIKLNSSFNRNRTPIDAVLTIFHISKWRKTRIVNKGFRYELTHKVHVLLVCNPFLCV